MQKKRGRTPKGGQVVKKSIKKKPEECNKNITSCKYFITLSI